MKVSNIWCGVGRRWNNERRWCSACLDVFNNRRRCGIGRLWSWRDVLNNRLWCSVGRRSGRRVVLIERRWCGVGRRSGRRVVLIKRRWCGVGAGMLYPTTGSSAALDAASTRQDLLLNNVCLEAKACPVQTDVAPPSRCL